MAIYAIGDVQGCFAPLEKLLTIIQFDSMRDTLWFTGDLVNRGSQSLAALRFIKSLDQKHQVVLGNHDLHLLAVAFGVAKKKSADTLDEVLAAPDCDELIDWLRHQPLLVYDATSGFVLTHAGLAPSWTLDQAIRYAQEVEAVLQGKSPEIFLQQMYGNQPDYWSDSLTGVDRLRSIVNHFTRLRLCHQDGRMDFNYKGTLQDCPRDLIPWFDVSHRVNKEIKIIFGHWAALQGKADMPNVYPLDTGCVWGNCLTAMRLEDQQKFSVKC
ncbi:MAG: hypothetical protein ACD_46C00114G0001 [uncultured bacterium]|nr:MAG: hypothetical protein ACD_46C00114G0001 [uncultured bacterium]